MNSSESSRNLILCFDGTGNKFGVNSNVVRFFRALRKDQPDKQLVYYQAGIGTYNKRQFYTKTLSKIASTIDQAIAYHLKDHVKDGYRFLMQHYRPGDKIFLFGFSRGAYTARALAGMLHRIGLLPSHNLEQIDFAFSIFDSDDAGALELNKDFKDIFAIPVTVEFVGVWDTVSSVGIIPSQLPCSSSNYAVKTFRHALALDERRARFRPSIWNEPISRGVQLEDDPIVTPRGNASRDDWVYEPPERHFTDVKEVWFAGCHADVGGGSHDSSSKASLSAIPLRWMIKECFAVQTGILFNDGPLYDYGLDPVALKADPTNVDTSEPAGDPLPITAEHHPGHVEPHNVVAKYMSGIAFALQHKNDYDDIIASIYDQLSLAKFWWGLEFIPLLHTYQQEDGTWMRRRSRNFGRGRYLPHSDLEIKVHASVFHKIDKDPSYKPSAYNWDLARESGMLVQVV